MKSTLQIKQVSRYVCAATSCMNKVVLSEVMTMQGIYQNKGWIVSPSWNDLDGKGNRQWDGGLWCPDHEELGLAEFTDDDGL